MIFLLYSKLSKLSQYTVRSQEIGKIINLLANDFNTLEAKGPVFLVTFVTPLTLAGIIAILVTRFGWPGILIFCVVVAMLPIQLFVGKINGRLI
jgi:ABC-type transport system involved in cytochrome bd biosynthesis fused ATPase/permease subunit